MTAGCCGDSVGLLEVSPATSHPPTAGGARTEGCWSLPCQGGPWSSQVAAFNEHQGHGAPCCLHPSPFGSLNPEQTRASCAARKGFNLLGIFPSHGAAFILLGSAKLLDLLLTGNVRGTCPFPSPAPDRRLIGISGSMAHLRLRTSAGATRSGVGTHPSQPPV